MNLIKTSQLHISYIENPLLILFENHLVGIQFELFLDYCDHLQHLQTLSF